MLLRTELPPRLSFPIAVAVFIPGRKWEDPWFFAALFDCSGVDLKSRHILSLSINTLRWRI